MKKKKKKRYSNQKYISYENTEKHKYKAKNLSKYEYKH